MQWNGEGVILSARKHGENSVVARIFAKDHGVFAGVVKGAHSKTNRGIIHPGNVVSATWNARLSEHIGLFKIELLTANAAQVMHHAAALTALQTACSLIELALPERHPYHKLYLGFLTFLEKLKVSDDWTEAYVRFELALLAESGFGLDLSRCAGTGATQDLVYVSPKSGRAVSREAGAPYKDKLLPLPFFLQNGALPNRIEKLDIQDGLTLSGYFLEHWLLAPHGRKLPAVRSRLKQFL